MEENKKKTNILTKIFITIVIIGLAFGAIFLGKYFAELTLEKNGGLNISEQNTNVSIPLKTE